MPDTTPVYDLPFPELGDAPNGADQIEALAVATETELVRIDALVAPSSLTAYTPTWTGSGSNPNVGTAGTLSGLWMKRGLWVEGMIRVIIGSAAWSTGAGTYEWSLPPGQTAATAFDPVGVGTCFNADTVVTFTRVSWLNTPTTLCLGNHDGVRVGSSTPIGGLATGDRFHIRFRYLAASA